MTKEEAAKKFHGIEDNKETNINGTSGFLNVSEYDNATSSGLITFDSCMPDYVGGWYYDEKSLGCGTKYAGLFIQTTYIPNALEKKMWGFAGFVWRSN